MMRWIPCRSILLLATTLLWSGCGQEKESASSTESTPALQVTDLVPGNGLELTSGDYFSAHYRGWLYVDGQKGDEFDNSHARGEPLTVRLGRGQVIAGWDQGLVGMRVGGKRALIVPAELAFGARGSGKIPPHSPLMFEVELLDIPSVTYEVLTPAEGPVAAEGDQIEIHFTAWVVENGRKGRQFDSTRDRDQTFQFTLGVGHVLPGLDLGVTGMRVGEVRMVTVPSVLAYGSQGRQQGGREVVPPAAVLLFEVELMRVLGKQ